MGRSCPQTCLVRHNHGILSCFYLILCSNGWKTLIDIGSSSAWMSSITILLNPGDSYLCGKNKYLVNIFFIQRRLYSRSLRVQYVEALLCFQTLICFFQDSALLQGSTKDLLPVAVATDQDGLSAVDLERVLTSWDSKARGSSRFVVFSISKLFLFMFISRPRVIYTQGGIQNPTGLVCCTTNISILCLLFLMTS